MLKRQESTRPQSPLGMWKTTSALGRHAESAMRLGQFAQLVSRHRCRLDAKVSRAPNVRPSSTFLRESMGDGHCLCTCCSRVSVRCYAKSKDKKSVKGSALPPYSATTVYHFSFFLFSVPTFLTPLKIIWTSSTFSHVGTIRKMRALYKFQTISTTFALKLGRTEIFKNLLCSRCFCLPKTQLLISFRI